MKLIALMLCRNSDWAIGLSLRAALMYCDEAVVLMHNCTDRTAEIVYDIGIETGQLLKLREDNPHWREMAQRDMMLNDARSLGATHIMLLDDDEVLSGNLLPTIRAEIEQAPVGTIVQLPWLSLRDGIGNVMTSGAWGRAEVSAAFKDHPVYHWQAQEGGYDHHFRHPMGIGAELKPKQMHRVATDRSGGLMHLQFASRRRLIAKQALYKMNEVLRWPDRQTLAQVDQMYSNTVKESDAASTMPVPESWWAAYRSLMQYLDVNREPWQEGEIKRLILHYGIEHFAGLNLFGLDETLLK